jgi:tight adherence protein B
MMLWLIVLCLLVGAVAMAWPTASARRRLAGSPVAKRPFRIAVDTARLRAGAVALASRSPRRLAGLVAGVAAGTGMVLGGPVAAFVLAVYGILLTGAFVRRTRRKEGAVARAASLDNLAALGADLRAGLPPVSASDRFGVAVGATAFGSLPVGLLPDGVVSADSDSDSGSVGLGSVGSGSVGFGSAGSGSAGSGPAGSRLAGFGFAGSGSAGSASAGSASAGFGFAGSGSGGSGSARFGPGRSPTAISAERRIAELTDAVWRLAEQTGAPAADLVERIEADARAADRARAGAAAQAAGAQATALLLAALPLAGIGLGYTIGADPLQVLLHTPLGAACAVGAVLLQCGGMLWADRLANGPTR